MELILFIWKVEKGICKFLNKEFAWGETDYYQLEWKYKI